MIAKAFASTGAQDRSRLPDAEKISSLPLTRAAAISDPAGLTASIPTFASASNDRAGGNSGSLENQVERDGRPRRAGIAGDRHRPHQLAGVDERILAEVPVGIALE